MQMSGPNTDQYVVMLSSRLGFIGAQSDFDRCF